MVAKTRVALLVDANSGRTLYAREPNRRFAPASMAKVMTVYLALEEMKAGRLSPSRRFVVSEAVAREWNGKGTSLYLRGGQEIDVDTLLHGIATVSANDASVVLAEGYAGDVARWCALMNEQARKLGMADSHFATPSGWPDGGRTYVSARDLVTLGEALVRRHPEEYRRYFGQKRMTFAGVEQQSHDPTVGVVRGADGIKTGHTHEAGYNFLSSAARDGQRLIMVVGGAASEADRAAVSRGLLEWGFSAWRSRPLFSRGATIGDVRVQNGEERSVPLVTDRALATIDPIGVTAGRARARLLYNGPLVAPIAKGARVAEIEITSADSSVQRFPLYAAASVAAAGPLDRLVNGLVGLFS
jgi:serine-type D-Ala-D-Ala carboxypeptidase (penicillin-binding protein 5/6)